MRQNARAFVTGIVAAALLWPAWSWSARERYQMNSQKKYIESVVAPAVVRGQAFPDGAALAAMIRNLREYLDRHPDDTRAAMVLALCYRAQHRYEDATAVYQRLEQIEPRGEIQLQLGHMATRSGDLDAAERHYLQALRSDLRLLEHIRDRPLRRELLRTLRAERPWLSSSS